MLYASQNDPQYKDGYYRHGRYPFVLDRLFPIEDSPAGFGYIDIMQSPQLYIDKPESASLSSKMVPLCRASALVYPRFARSIRRNLQTGPRTSFMSPDAWRTEISSRSRWIPCRRILQTISTQKLTSSKETSGNRDFAQGGTASGVTAAAAIAALQEAGNKLSRDMLRYLSRIPQNHGALH